MYKKMLAVLCICVAMAGFTGCGGKSEEGSNEVSGAEDIELEENQSEVCGKITEINGNDVKITVATKEKVEFDGKDMPEGEKPEGMPEGEMPEGMPEGEMPEGMPEGDMPEGEMPESEMPEGERPEMPDRENGASDGSTDSSSDSDSKQGGRRMGAMYRFTMTDEEKEYTIPVGTVVTTQFGGEVTFSDLKTEDMINIVVDKDEEGNETVSGIWILQDIDKLTKANNND